MTLLLLLGSGSLGANFAFDDMALSPYLATPRVSGVHDLPPAVVSRQFVPGCSVPGETVLRRDLVTMTFGCVAWAEDHTSLVANLRTIKGLVSPGIGWAPLWVVDRPTQRTMALSRGFPLRTNAIPYCTTVAEFDLSFERLPWWEDLSAQSATIDEADTTGTITNDGDLSCWPVYTCTVGAAPLAGGLTFTVNGKTYTYEDALDAADVLTVDTEACTTERNGTADMSGTADDCEYPELATGANAVTAKTAGFTLTATYRRRYE